MSNFEWLLSEADFALPLSPHFTADDENWRADIEMVALAPSLHLFLNDIDIRRDFRSEPMAHRDGQFICCQVTIEGDAGLDFPDGVHARTGREASGLFRAAERLPVYDFKSGVRFHSVGYSLDLARVERLFDGELPAALGPLFDADFRRSHFVGTPCNDAMRGLAEGLFVRRLNGPLRQLMLEGGILQLLATQIAAANAAAPPGGRRALSPRERTAVGEARDRLLADMRQPPALGDLAVAVGLTEKRLNAGFRQMFGATAFELLRNLRLDHARQALAASPMAMKEIAYRVGYNHVSNFVHAYRARFGEPPRQHVRRTTNDG